MASVSSRKRQPILLLWSNRTLSLNLEASLGTPLAGPRRGRREGVEVQRQLHVLDRIPQRLPDRVPHRLHVPGARQFEAFDAYLRDAADFLHRIVDVAILKTGETDLTVRIVAAETSEPIVVDAAEMSAGTSDDPFAPKAVILASVNGSPDRRVGAASPVNLPACRRGEGRRPLSSHGAPNIASVFPTGDWGIVLRSN